MTIARRKKTVNWTFKDSKDKIKKRKKGNKVFPAVVKKITTSLDRLMPRQTLSANQEFPYNPTIYTLYALTDNGSRSFAIISGVH